MEKSKHTGKIGVLLMAYGSPENLDEVEPYITHLRGGKKPSNETLAAIKKHYQLVGGKTPLKQITLAQAASLQKLLDNDVTGTYLVSVGMKHWHPFIKDSIKQLQTQGITQLIALPLAPHYSKMSIGAYKEAVIEALGELHTEIPLTFIEHWHMNSHLLSCIASQLGEVLAKTDLRKTHVFFTAHSLPERILTWQDPYKTQLLETAEAVAHSLSLPHYSFAFQSAGMTPELWLGPDIIEEMRRVKQEGFENMIICPIGFVSDHLEILFDIDIECQAFAKEEGISLQRTESRNTHPQFIAALAEVVTHIPVQVLKEQVRDRGH